MEKDGSVSIHLRNLRMLSVEMFKVSKSLIPVIIAEHFPARQQNQYNMKNYSFFATPCPKPINHELQSLS